ncbi:hypothetical protein ACFRDV_26925 [Streptomyces fagopyri]|uniref:hypothetical protein n=1 Tax=Streptomyces fagopyri TaxID=2662397 RepID=UPI0036AB13B7
MLESTGWGWLAWTVPSDGSLPRIPHQIGVLAPHTGRLLRAVLRWQSTRTNLGIALGPTRLWVRRSTLCAAVASLLVGLLAIRAGLAVDVALPATALAPMLIEHMEDRLEATAAAHVRRIQGPAACRYAHRLAALQHQLIQFDGHSRGTHTLGRAVAKGHGLLWEVATLLQEQDTRSLSWALIDRETLMLRLVDRAAKLTPGFPVSSP